MTHALEPSFISAIHELARLTRKRFEHLTRDLGPTRAQWQILATLARYEGISQSGVADILELEPITVGRLIDRMAEAGWVERRSDPKDRRAYRLFMTEKARPLLDELRSIAAIVTDEALADLDPAEREILNQLLLRVRNTVVEKLGRGRAANVFRNIAEAAAREMEKAE